MVNELFGDRTPDPNRIMRAYSTAASTLNLLRAYAGGGLASLNRVHAWNTTCARSTETGARYERLAAEIDRAVRFMRACGVHDAALEGVELYAGHEGLILEYAAGKPVYLPQGIILGWLPGFPTELILRLPPKL